MHSEMLQSICEEVLKEKVHVPHYRNAIFDFDNTCIQNDIGDAVLAYICKNKLLKNKNLLTPIEGCGLAEYHESVFRKYHQLKKEREFQKAYEFSAKTIAGLSLNEVEEIVKKTIEDEGEEPRTEKQFGITIKRGLKLKEDTMELMHFLTRNNVKTWIVSASPWEVVGAAAKHYDIKARCIGIRNVIKDEELTEDIIYPTPIVEGKVLCIKKYVHPKIKPILAIGDSQNDIPMLYYSTIKVIAKDHTLDSVTEMLVKDSRHKFYFL